MRSAAPATIFLLRWEGAPDTAFFRSVTWSYLHELPVGALTTAEDDLPRLRVDVTVPAGALSQRRKAGLVGEVTPAVLAAAGLPQADALRAWVLIHEHAEGKAELGCAVTGQVGPGPHRSHRPGRVR